MAYDFTIKYAGPPINGETKGWSPEDPITASKMNNIEAGIVEAWNKAFEAYTKSETDKEINDLSDYLNGRIDGVKTTAEGAASAAA